MATALLLWCTAHGLMQQPGMVGSSGWTAAVQLPPKSFAGAPDVDRCFAGDALFPGAVGAGMVSQLDRHCIASGWPQPAPSLPPAEQTLVKTAQRTSVKINGVVKG